MTEEPSRDTSSNSSSSTSYKATEQDLAMYESFKQPDKSNKLNGVLLTSCIASAALIIILLIFVFGIKKEKDQLASKLEELEMEVKTLNWDRKKTEKEIFEIRLTKKNTLMH